MKRWLLAGCVLAAVLALSMQTAWGLFFPEEYVIEIRMDGLACGSHLLVSPAAGTIKPGSRITIVNKSPWTHTVRIARDDSYAAEAIAQSPALESGETWRTRMWYKGTYYIVPDNRWHYLAGLRGQLVVAR